MADKVAIYNTERTEVRPPKIWRLPRCLPLSWLKGATPTKTTILAVELAQFRQVSHQGGGGDKTDPRHTLNPFGGLAHSGLASMAWLICCSKASISVVTRPYGWRYGPVWPGWRFGADFSRP